jgi:hypothetical protein
VTQNTKGTELNQLVPFVLFCGCESARAFCAFLRL